ncbi:site-specific DNA-methyltransferase [Corynebacterium accolens]|uniref:site-specific DNA-methyltransferase n=1 Tax=Corynebacterium accolens TaxID=38284 RepID=UPI002542923B|nr:site-specific DNA-methyltransferase [Corynebacterium accolens]MDK4233635.1 site-specific DNA-methyltransferase [Corynebacterium accolens]WKS66614.1 site-specific DNA-methyltransferase [Corynebacterium accolens]
MTKQRLELTWYNKDKALIPTEQGKYGYTWVDPTDPRYCQTHFLDYGEVVRGEQQPKQEGRTYSERADFTPTDDNLLILGESGDVLETLTRVPELTDKYVGKVKCIYIDPPFNTAQTFANYEDNLEHSVWLTMMRDRLLHLKKLLSNDGSIWVHLDDVENHRMRLLMDEVFGAENFVAEVVWQKTYSPRNDSKGIPAVTDVILVYSKGEFVPNRLARTAEMNSIYKNPDNDPRGPWTSDNANAPGAATHLGMIYGIQHPITGEMVYPSKGNCWRYSQDKMLEIFSGWGPYERGEITNEEIAAQQEIAGHTVQARTDVPPLVMRDWETNRKQAEQRYEEGNWPQFYPTRGGTGGFRRKTYLKDVDTGRLATNYLPHAEVGHTDTAAKEIRALFPGTAAFSTPKPERLLERIIHIATDPGDIVLDVFAGSGTTAAVAHKMGRRWVTCELVEDTFNRFTGPRLEKVVRGEDMGGITVTKGERVDATETGLPEGLSAEDAQKLTSLLNKAVKDEPELKKSADLRAVKQLVKTKKSPDTINWRGGGGFTTARLSRDCFDVDEDTGLVVLTEDATARNLSAAVAAHLRFRMTPNNPVFPAKREKMNLFVTRQPLTQEFIDELVYYVPDGEAVTVAATSADSDLGRYLHKACPGSRIIHLPDGLFTRTLSHAKEA